MRENDAPRALLRAMFDAAVASAQPALCVPPHVPTAAEVGEGRLIVVGAGKASAAMARAVEDHWTGAPEALSGLVVTRYGHAVPCSRIRIAEAAHPVPDAAGHAAAESMLSQLQGLRAEDFVLCLISGGGSALLPQPAPGLSFEDEQAVNEILLASGAPISVMNVIRSELSAIKGGRLAAMASPARVATLIVSASPGDDPSLVASGPTVPLASGRAEARH
jgi:glycerate 2-kinase